MAAEPTWERVEFPLLLEVSEAERTGGRVRLNGGPAGEPLERMLAGQRLIEAGYVTGPKPLRDGGQPIVVVMTGLTERGLRAVGAWPAPDADVGALFLEVLERAAEEAVDDGDRSRLRKVGEQARGLGRDTLANVIAAVIARQTGIG